MNTNRRRRCKLLYKAAKIFHTHLGLTILNVFVIIKYDSSFAFRLRCLNLTRYFNLPVFMCIYYIKVKLLTPETLGSYWKSSSENNFNKRPQKLLRCLETSVLKAAVISVWRVVIASFARIWYGTLLFNRPSFWGNSSIIMYSGLQMRSDKGSSWIFLVPFNQICVAYIAGVGLSQKTLLRKNLIRILIIYCEIWSM